MFEFHLEIPSPLHLCTQIAQELNKKKRKPENQLTVSPWSDDLHSGFR